MQCFPSSRVLKGTAVEVPWEHDDSAVPGQPAFTRRLIDLPVRANGSWSRTKRNNSLKQGEAGWYCPELNQV